MHSFRRLVSFIARALCLILALITHTHALAQETSQTGLFDFCSHLLVLEQNQLVQVELGSNKGIARTLVAHCHAVESHGTNGKDDHAIVLLRVDLTIMDLARLVTAQDNLVRRLVKTIRQDFKRRQLGSASRIRLGTQRVVSKEKVA